MSTNSRPWFEVDRAGLAKLVDGRSKALIIFELVQNVWDQDVSRVDVELHPVPGSAAATLSVIDDDPDGFRDLTHAYTLFAESGKKCDPEKRGRFNLGEKLVLAMCSEARIVTTSGGFAFLPSGERKAIRQRRKRGSEFCGMLRMTREEYRAALEAVRLLLPREGVSTYFNGVLLAPRAACNTFRTRLKTVVADERGVLREARRETEVRLYEPREGERAVLYEMGIPVVETGDRWHADVRQKIPLNAR